MRRLVLATPFFLILTTAQAADRHWDGFYIGGNLGYGKAKATADFAILGVPAFNASENLDGFVYGVQAGYNMQSNRFVLGIEADIQATSLKATSSRVCVALACGPLAITQSSDDSIPWLGTLRMRAGFAVDRFLVYGTGGVAYGEFKSTQTLTTNLGTVTSQSSNQRMAWAAGAGVEAALGRNWSMKLEYLYIDTGKFTTTYSLAGTGVITEEDRMTNSIVRLGLNYRF